MLRKYYRRVKTLLFIVMAIFSIIIHEKHHTLDQFCQLCLELTFYSFTWHAGDISICETTINHVTNTCYWVNAAQLTNQDAKDACVASGGFLAYVKTQFTHDFLVAATITTNGYPILFHQVVIILFIIPKNVLKNWIENKVFKKSDV